MPFGSDTAGNKALKTEDVSETSIPMGSESFLKGIQCPPSIPTHSRHNDISVEEQISNYAIADSLRFSTIPYRFGKHNAELNAEIINEWIPYHTLLPPIPPLDSRRMDERTKQEQWQKKCSLDPLINIQRVISVNPASNQRFDALFVEYNDGCGMKTVALPYEAFSDRKMLGYFWGVRARDNKWKMANDYLYEEICIRVWAFVAVPSIPGWKRYCYQLDRQLFNKLIYIPVDMTTAILKNSELPPLKPRTSLPTPRSLDAVLWDYNNMIPHDPVIRSLWAFRIASQMLSLFGEHKIVQDHMLVLEPSQAVSADYLISLLQTLNDSGNAIPLNSNKEICISKLRTVNDGTVLFRDTDLLGERKKAETAITSINNDVQCASGVREQRGSHLVAVISPYAAEWFPNEKTLWISLDNTDIQFQCSASVLHEFVREFDALVIRIIEQNAGWFEQTFNQLLVIIRNAIPKNIPVYRIELYVMLVATMRLVNLMFESAIFEDADRKYLTELLREVNTFDLSEQVIDEFTESLNDCIRKQEIQIVDRKHTRLFEPDKNMVIAMDNILGLEVSTITGIISSKMRHRVSLQNLVRILDREKILYNPEHKHHNNRHTITMQNADGEDIDVHVYSIDRNVLSPDVRQMIDNLAHIDFLLGQNECLSSDFLPMIRCNGKLVGKTMRYQDEEDNHLSISGQTSSGKTYALAQRAAFLADLHHHVVILDAEGAFSKEKLFQMLPADYVEKTVAFQGLETDGIPVDLFHLERKNGNTDKSILEGILTAGSRKLTGPQLEALRTAISNLLQTLEPSERIKPEDIRTMLDEPGAAYDNLKARLNPVLEDLSEFKMDSLTWGQYFENSNPILVLSLQPAFRQSGHKLVDMLLASLYNYQVRNFECPLDIIMDEIQNQNLSDTGPLWKIVTGGRKFHMSVSCATQEYIASRNDTLGSLMGKFRNKVFMSPTSDSETAVASVLGYGSKKKRMFDAMERGDCIMKMPCYNKETNQNHYITISGHILSYEEWHNMKK